MMRDSSSEGGIMEVGNGGEKLNYFSMICEI